MRLFFSGAAHEVTGSKHYLEAAGKKILIDCGMEQGKNLYENQEIPVPASDVDYVFLTHAHIDHSGMLPLLYNQGFKGSVYTTEATQQLCQIMLLDSAHIQEFEAEWKNRKGKRAGIPPIVPIYTTEDAVGILQYFVPCRYEEKIQVCDGIEIRFVDAGHLLGSASIEVWVTEQGVTKKLVFSGDIGNTNQPIIKDPQYIREADYVIMESTYGDRSHGPRPDYIRELTAIIQRTFDRGGNVVIPSFAVGRTQEMLYFIRQIKAEGLVKNHDNFEVYDSIAINVSTTPKVIISASGMCDAGRIRHHLKHNLWRPECTILFVGYQSVGTLGRNLVEGATEVKLFGETIEVQAEITSLAGISGHADCEGLMKWIGAFEKKPDRVFVVHVEDTVTDVFASRIKDELGIDAVAPYTGAEYDLLTNECIQAPEPVRVTPKKAMQRKAATVFERLLNAGRRLMLVIRHNEGGTNKDLTRFTNEINNLCDKWDR